MTPTHILQLFASTAETESEGIAALGIDPWAILAQGVTFLVLFVLIKKFALGKIVKTLEDRRKTIENSLDQAEELKKQNEATEKRMASLLREARKEAEMIIEKSHEEAGSIVQEAQGAAGEKAQAIIEGGKKQIEAEVQKARDTLKKDTLELVGQATSALLNETVDAKKHEALIKQALKDKA